MMIPVSTLAPLSAFYEPVWDTDNPSNPCGVLSREDIQSAIDAGHLNARLYIGESAVGWTKADHAARVAYLVLNPSDYPIRVRINDGAPERIHDGNHRLAAAVFRGDSVIAMEEN